MFSGGNNFSFEAFKNGENCISLESAFFNGKHRIEFNNIASIQMPFSIEVFQKKMKAAILYGDPVQTAYEMLDLDFNSIGKFPEGYEVNTETTSQEILYYKFEYSKVHILGEVNAWYLNESGEMCVITNNHGFEKNAANNILRIYAFQKVEG